MMLFYLHIRNRRQGIDERLHKETGEPYAFERRREALEAKVAFITESKFPAGFEVYVVEEPEER